MARPPLTRRQHEILQFFQDYTVQQHISPTLEEIAQHFGLSKVTVFGHVSELERKGILTRSKKGISRGLQLADEPGSSLRILGSIAAGAPIDTLEEPETLDLGELVPDSKDVYVLRVEGQSMIEDAICDGDLVLVERRTDPREGEIDVAVLPGETATLKRFYRQGSGFRLEPANSSMQPIHTPELEVRGVVIGVVRRF